MSRKKSLDKRNKTYCRSICNEVEKIRFKPKRNDYPAMAVTAEYNGYYYSKARSGCGHWYTTETEFYIQLLLKEPIGGKSNWTGCKNHIGNCAEQRASDYLSRKTRINGLDMDYKQIQFSAAMRPRIVEAFPKCDNCNNYLKKSDLSCMI